MVFFCHILGDLGGHLAANFHSFGRSFAAQGALKGGLQFSQQGFAGCARLFQGLGGRCSRHEQEYEWHEQFLLHGKYLFLYCAQYSMVIVGLPNKLKSIFELGWADKLK